MSINMIDRSDQLKRVYAFLLTGNDPIDLMDSIIERWSDEHIEQLDKHIQLVEKDQEVNYVEIFDQSVDISYGRTIWS